MKKKDISNKIIYDLYVVQQKSQRQVAKILGISQSSVRRYLAKYNIASRCKGEYDKTPDYIQQKKELADRYCNEYQKHIIKRCKFCGKEFEVDGEHKKKQFCCPECVRQYRRTQSSLFKQKCENCGKIISQEGRLYKVKYCDECLPKIRRDNQIKRIETECGYCHKSLYVIPSRYHKNEFCYCGVDCMSKHYSEIYAGENSPTWQGGKGHHYTGGFWTQRNKARKRDDYTCQRCGVTEKEFGQQMSVHHIKNYRLFSNKTEANELDNLICLCEKCHRFVHSNANVDKLYIQEELTQQNN